MIGGALLFLAAAFLTGLCVLGLIALGIDLWMRRRETPAYVRPIATSDHEGNPPFWPDGEPDWAWRERR